MRSTIAVALWLFVLASEALAVDGVLEINHACATNAGCVGGDAAGYPVTIDGSAGRSYRLTSDLALPDQNTDGIVVSSPGVSIDLNGFQIVRSSCVGQTTSCLSIGSGIGVRVSSASIHGVSVRNGSIVGMGSDAASLGDQAEARNLRTRWNGGNGIDAGSNSIVSHCSASGNALGIVLGDSSTISDSVISTTIPGTGIQVGDNAIVARNTIEHSSSTGLLAGANCFVVGNVLDANGAGIGTGASCTVSQNSLRNNNSDGITAGAYSRVRGNSVQNCITCLILPATAGYSDNSLSGNASGGINAGGNTCGSGLCP
jgi:hypothetical protein